MWESWPDFPCLVAQSALKRYHQLPTKGKPLKGKEWTPLAAILQHDGTSRVPEVVAMGTGSKCIGQNKLSKEGWIVNDSHAETIARRAFLRYLLNQLRRAVEGCPSIFIRSCPGHPNGGKSCQQDSGECGGENVDATGAECGLLNLYTLKHEVSFHFFSTQVPCGDAAIFPQAPKFGSQVSTEKKRSSRSLNSSPEIPRSKRLKTESVSTSTAILTTDGCTTVDLSPQQLDSELPIKVSESTTLSTSECPGGTTTQESTDYDLVATTPESGNCLVCMKAAKQVVDKPWDDSVGQGTISGDMEEHDTHRTGARCVHGGAQDLKAPGLEYHVTGALRTKPGRGDPTTSMSCSDKMLRWNVLGCQGALLSHFISHPIVFASCTISSTVFNREALSRAVFNRITDSCFQNGISIHHPKLFHCLCLHDNFLDSGLVDSVDRRPSSTALCFCSSSKTSEVLVQGLQQGANVKLGPHRKASVSICKRRIFEEFIRLLSAVTSDDLPISLRNWRDSMKTYYSFKEASARYSSTRNAFLSMLPMWSTNSPQLEQFVC